MADTAKEVEANDNRILINVSVPFGIVPGSLRATMKFMIGRLLPGIETEINNSIFAMQTICRNIVEVWATPFVSLASKRRAISKGERAREEER